MDLNLGILEERNNVELRPSERGIGEDYWGYHGEVGSFPFPLGNEGILEGMKNIKAMYRTYLKLKISRLIIL